MAEQWKQAYKTIYGKSPGKADYTLAPSNVSKEVLKKKGEGKEGEEKGRNLFAPTRLKRPAQYSPVKQMVKRRAVQPIQEEESEKPVSVAVLRESPRKKLNPLPPAFAASPVKKSVLTALSGDSCFKSPSKPFPVSRVTPLKKMMDSVNPSPRKPLARNKVMISCADTLYETKSPMKKTEAMKKENEIPFEELQAGDEEAMKIVNKPVYRKKNSDTNFLKLNLKKGYQAKGHMTAEQKRKFKRKANFKKFKAGQ